MMMMMTLIKVYWDDVKDIWFATSTEDKLDINNELFWLALTNNYSFNDCLLNKDYKYTFDFHDNKEIILTSVISTKNGVELTGLDLHMTSVSIGLK